MSLQSRPKTEERSEATDTRARSDGALVARRHRWGLVFVAPGVAFFALFFLYPLAQSFYLSLTHYNFLSHPRFAGAANYRGLLHDRIFLHSLLTTAAYVLASTIPTTVLALCLAIVLQRRGRITALVGAAFFVPAVMSDVVVTIVWKLMFNQFGPISSLFSHIGKASLGWTSSPNLVPWTIVWITVWQWTGWTAVIYLAGLRTIPRNVYDAARVDGAKQWQMLRDITIPLLRPTIFFVIATSIVSSAQSFGYQYVVSSGNGGPVYSTNVVGLEIYNTAFSDFDAGRAAAMSIVLLFLLLGVLAVLVRLYPTELKQGDVK